MQTPIEVEGESGVDTVQFESLLQPAEGTPRTTKELEYVDRRIGEVEEEVAAAEDSLYSFKRRHATLPRDPIEMDRLSRQLSHLQQLVNQRTALYRSLLSQREMIRLKQAHPKLPEGEGIQVLSSQQQLLNSRLTLYRNLLDEREQVRRQVEREGPKFEVLNYAAAEDAEEASWGMRQRVGLSAGAGLVVFIFLAFFMEFVDRNRKSGRMDRVRRELRGDPFFRWFVR